jgi:predicted AlkP superfamily pyrophosphatase or phosphodiesterase
MRFSPVLLIMLLIPVAALAAAEPRVMIVSVDGLRPDLIYRAKMSNVQELIKGGSFTLWAQTVPMAVTMPSHASMLTGVTVERHGITANDDKGIAQQTLQSRTIFQYAKAAEISSGLAAGKSKFSILETDADYVWLTRQKTTKDAEVADHAIAIIRNNKPRLMVVHFPQNDNIGHKIGWGTPEQLEGLADTDRQLGRLLSALDEAGVREGTTIILSADHGGQGQTHGKDDPRSLHIPWIVRGPGVRVNFDLTRDQDLNVKTYDTFATACHVLGIAVPPGIDGKPILLAFENVDLLDTATTRPTAPGTTTRPAMPSASRGAATTDRDPNVAYGDEAAFFESRKTDATTRPATRPALDNRQSNADTRTR